MQSNQIPRVPRGSANNGANRQDSDSSGVRNHQFIPLNITRTLPFLRNGATQSSTETVVINAATEGAKDANDLGQIVPNNEKTEPEKNEGERGNQEPGPSSMANSEVVWGYPVASCSRWSPSDSEEGSMLEYQLPETSDDEKNLVEDSNSSSEIPDTDSNLPSGNAQLIEDMIKADKDSQNYFGDQECVHGDDTTELDVEFLFNHVNATRANSTNVRLCNQCSEYTFTNYGSCNNCFQMRRQWLPKRPLARRLKAKKADRLKGKASKASTSDSDASREDIDKEKLNGGTVDKSKSFKGNDDPTSRAIELCPVCYLTQKDSAFVHGKTAHTYCCFKCADKILKESGRCPICRRRVLRVVKVIG